MPRLARSNTPQAPQTSPTILTSRENRWLKRFRAVLSGERGEDGTVGVEGVRLVEAALGSGLPAVALLVSESGARHLARVARVRVSDVPVFRTSDKLFAGVADTQSPQGIAALVRPRSAAIEDLLRGTALVMVLAGVQDPGNVGTIMRTAEAFGATGAATCIAGGIGTADPLAPKALRASAGSVLRLPIVHGVSLSALLEELRRSQVKIFATVADAATATPGTSNGTATVFLPWDVDLQIPSAILIGNEGSGLPPEILREADACVCIPQAAASASIGIESLNAAMAASVLLYEAMRQRLAARKHNP
jgi:TrmH family RNA methyltransferase